MNVAKTITIDLNRPRKEVVHLGQGDSFTRWIELTLLCDGIPYDPTADLDALGIQDGSDADIIKTVKYIKANGVPGEYEKIPENGTTPAVALMDGETNVYVVRLDEHATDVPGFAEIFVTFYVEDSDENIHVLHTFPITLDVVQNTTNATDPGSPYYNIHSFYVKPVGGIPASDLAPDAIGTGLSDEAKEALLACFAHVAWSDEHGQEYYDALEAALYPPADLEYISAVYTQSGTVYDTDSLDSLKPDLIVYAHYAADTEVVASYELSGTLAVGTSTITVTYGGKAATFDVTVTAGILTGYTEVGTPSISDNILTVASNNFIKAPFAFSPGDSAWKISCKYMLTGRLPTNYGDIFGGVDTNNDSVRSLLFELNNATGTSGGLFLSSNNTSWDISSSTGNLTGYSANNWCWIEMEFTGTAYTLKFSLDGASWTTIASKTSTTKVIGGYAVAFGLKRSAQIVGTIDLSECKIYIGGELYWKAVA